MTRKEMPKSLRKHIRKEKARIKQEAVSLEKKKKLISDLYEKILKKHSKNKKS